MIESPFQLLTAVALDKPGIIFNGISTPESEQVILQHSNYKQLLKIPVLEQVNPEVISKYAKTFNSNLKTLYHW